MRRFRSLEAIRQASIEELASVTGMTREAAERLKERL
jgi:excinuclease UvrABC nuclease subunit